MISVRRQIALGVAFVLSFAALSFGGKMVAHAEAPEQTRKELDAVIRDLDNSRARVNALQAEADILSRDRKALTSQLIETTARIRKTEAALEGTEDRLGTLNMHRQSVERTLTQRRAELAKLLAALQRMGRNPPPAVVVRPEDALTAVRSAMVLGTILPAVQEKADRVADELSELTRLRHESLAERSRLAAETEILDSERARLGKLVSLRQQSEQEAFGKLAEARAMTNSLARRSQSLRDLLAAIERAANSANKMPDEKQLAALTDPGRLNARVPFERALGKLPFPVAGAVVVQYGAPDNYGGEARGVSLAARSGETVSAPCDAWVVYSGPFRTYGQLLILNAGDGYHVVLAGLARTSVTLGQFVLTGEPVGRMETAAKTATEGENMGAASSKKTDAVLYVEFRKDGSAIDPSPWWAATRQEVQG